MRTILFPDDPLYGHQNAPTAAIFPSSAGTPEGQCSVGRCATVSGALCFELEWCLVRGLDATYVVRQRWKRYHTIWKGAGIILGDERTVLVEAPAVLLIPHVAFVVWILTSYVKHLASLFVL